MNCMGSEEVRVFVMPNSSSRKACLGGAFLSTCLLNFGSEMEAMCMVYTEHDCF